jgi:hypothetical protein
MQIQEKLHHSCNAGDGSFLADRRLVITTIGLLVILPMCFPRELGALAWVSMAAVCANPPPGLSTDLHVMQCAACCSEQHVILQQRNMSANGSLGHYFMRDAVSCALRQARSG